MNQSNLIKGLIYLGLMLAPVIGYCQPPIGNEGFVVIREIYKYDHELPLNPIIKQSKKYESHTREKIYFSGVRGRVGAYLAVPNNGEGPFSVILLIHGMGGSKERWWGKGNWSNGLETTEALITKGFAVFSIDAAMHGERKDMDGVFPPPIYFRKENLMLTVRNLIQQTVQDYMRGLDYLESRDDIEIENTGAYGLSMGGAITFILSGLDNRLKAAVAGVAVVYGNQNSAVNAYNFAPRITNTPFLMLMGDSDTFYTPSTATELFNSIGGNNNKLIIFEGGHKIPASYIPTIADWFEKRLD